MILYIDPENFDDMIRWNFDVGDPHFDAELHIKTTIKEHDEHYYVGGYSNKITTEYIGIRTDKTEQLNLEKKVFLVAESLLGFRKSSGREM